MQTYISRASGVLALLAWTLVGSAFVVNRSAHHTVIGGEVLGILCAAGVMFSLMFWTNVVVTGALRIREEERQRIYDSATEATLRALGQSPSAVVPMARRSTGQQV